MTKYNKGIEISHFYPNLSPGLFHRAILMSGSSFSEWAEVEDGISVTARLATVLNCSLPSDLSDQHPETIVCLRNLSAQALVNAPMPKYKFASLYGPSVDGIVITSDYKLRIARVSFRIYWFVCDVSFNL